jgi:hypothetical protein
LERVEVEDSVDGEFYKLIHSQSRWAGPWIYFSF